MPTSMPVTPKAPGTPMYRLGINSRQTATPKAASSATSRQFLHTFRSPTQSTLDKGPSRDATPKRVKTKVEVDEDDFSLFKRIRSTPKNVPHLAPPKKKSILFNRKTEREIRRENTKHHPRHMKPTHASTVRDEDFNPHEKPESQSSFEISSI